MDDRLERARQRRLAAEVGPGTRVKDAALRLALVYPSPYHVGMSSLGFLQIHRLANARPGTSAERAFLPDPDDLPLHLDAHLPLRTLERGRLVEDHHVIAISHAYELELAGVAQVLQLSGIPPLAADRDPARHPLVLLGGPITFSNPLPSAPFADVLILGEAEEALDQLLSRLEAEPLAARGNAEARAQLLQALAALPGFYVPSLHGEELPPIAQAPDHLLPAHSAIRTPDTELHDMVLIEPERGCHRGCTFCVMRRSTNGGMRLVEPATVDRLVEGDVRRVGLVGAAVSDHPGLKTILERLIDQRGLQVGISSLRADRLDDGLVGLLARGGYRSMTVALDAASRRLRDAIEKNLKDRAVEQATELAKAHGMKHLKLYVILGLPEETDEDLDELVAFALHLRKTLPVVLGVSPFVPKFHTPLADAPFMGEKEAERALLRLRRGLKGKVEVRGPGPREAYIEYRLAQGGHAHAQAAIRAAEAGASLTAWKRALAELPERVRPQNFHGHLLPAPTARRRYTPRLALPVL